MGGGGANSLDSPNIGENTVEDDDKSPEKEQGWATPIYKTYEDYFIDYFNLPSEAYTTDGTSITIDYSSITRTIVNGETSLSYNREVFDVITSKDLVGQGTASDPYIVHSIRGFLWLSNKNISQISLDSKCISLKCDVILNDESFDENGKPSGGDGVIYQWEPIRNGSNVEINGNNNSISGLYINTPEKSGCGLFWYTSSLRLKSIYNLSMAGLYIKGKNYTYSFGYSVNYLENVTTTGTIDCVDKYAFGFAFICYQVKNCENYINFYNSSWIGGFFGEPLTDGWCVENCNNYGKIYSPNKGAYMGGIFIFPAKKGKIINCNNFGDITGADNACGGIFGRSSGQQLIKGCKNYGKIDVETQYGGIVGFVEGVLTLDDCQNYGEVVVSNGGSCGLLVGYVSSRFIKGNTDININNCKTYNYFANVHVVGATVIEQDGSPREIYIDISKCEFVAQDEAQFTIVGVLNYANVFVSVKDVEIVANSKVLIVRSLNKKAILNIEYVIVRFCNSNAYLTICGSINNEIKSKIKVEGVICIIKNLRGIYYGSDFSGFYCDFKTGKIGLKALSGKGFYQGKVTEDLLVSKGFEKKVI